MSKYNNMKTTFCYRLAFFLFTISCAATALAQDYSWDHLPVITRPVFKKDTFSIAAYGARPDGITLNTTAINNAISQLGNVQSRVGAGENVLNYAINLANSQITNYSAAESGIKDANIAQEASNLTKAQVIQQASVAALAQANSTPQALLKLLQ